MRKPRTLVAAVLLLIAFGAVAVAPLALSAVDENETGTNFAVPPDLAPDAAQAYEDALKAYEKAHHARSGQTEKLAAAVKAMRHAKELAPRFAPPGYYLGILYQETHEFEKARAALKGALDLNPQFHQAIVELGDTYGWLKQPEKAIPEYDRALAVAPDYVHAYAMRGLTKLRAGDFAGALADFEQGKKVAAAKKARAAAKPGKPGAGPASATATAAPTATATTVARDDEPTEGPDGWIEAGIKMAKHELAGPGFSPQYVCETEHYRIITPVSQDFADDLGRHAEVIYRTYTKIFPKIDKQKRKFPVIVYANDADYHAAGGPEGAGGHYEPAVRKLNLFKYDQDWETKMVLYHEGFHQFLHDYLERAPQWFNEGLGDFFGASKYLEPPKGQKLGKMQLQPNKWRLHTIQACIKAGRYRGFRELMLMSQQELYQEEWVGIHYAESWSIIYFLVRGGAGPNDEAGPYFKLLKDYFQALRKGDGQETAFEAAFGKCDVRKLEEEWKKFTLSLQLPE